MERNAATPIQLEQIETEQAALKKKLEQVRPAGGGQERGERGEPPQAKHRGGHTEANAALEMARLNLSYTVVTAPCDGQLGRRAIEEGQFISAGQTITYIMPGSTKWVIANYKETQVENLYVGQPVKITVDAFPDKEFEGKVTAISCHRQQVLARAHRQLGRKLREDTATGAVRIDFTNITADDNALLAAGMMVIVKAKTR